MSAPKHLDAYDLGYYEDANAALKQPLTRAFQDRATAKKYRDRIYGFRDALRRTPEVDPKLATAFLSVSCTMREQKDGQWHVTVTCGDYADPIHHSTLITGDIPRDPGNPGNI